MIFKNEATIDVLVALFVLLALLHPLVSLTLAIVGLAGLGIINSKHRFKDLIKSRQMKF
jgi:hypothetical protein